MVNLCSLVPFIGGKDKVEVVQFSRVVHPDVDEELPDVLHHVLGASQPEEMAVLVVKPIKQHLVSSKI